MRFTSPAMFRGWARSGDDVHARIRYGRQRIIDACDSALAEVRSLGGTGGCVAVDGGGIVAMRFTSPAMFRGWARSAGDVQVGLDPGDVAEPR